MNGEWFTVKIFLFHIQFYLILMVVSVSILAPLNSPAPALSSSLAVIKEIGNPFDFSRIFVSVPLIRVCVFKILWI